MNMKRDIAVVVLNSVQYMNIIPGLKELLKKGYTIDFYCNDPDDSNGFKEMFADARKTLKENGFNVFEDKTQYEYQVLLEPYPSGIDIKAKYKIRYRYGNISAKPNVVYIPENYIQYDAVLCAGNLDANFLSVFTKTYITANPKYINFKKRKKKQKKNVLLYLPTYGKESSIELIYDELEKLKKDYYLVIKIHHGTTYLKDENNRISTLKNIADEFYDSNKELADLLAISDVVLTDNSGSIFESLYVEVPVAVFCDDINRNKQKQFSTIQYDMFMAGILPYSNKPNEITKILKDAKSTTYYNKQKEWAAKNLYRPKNSIKDFVEIIEKFINEDIDQKYYEMHDFFKDYFFNLKNDNQKLSNEILQKNEANESLNKKVLDLTEKEKLLENIISQNNNYISELQTKLSFYENGKLYKIAKKIYEIKNKEK